jgi:hypothetical protein
LGAFSTKNLAALLPIRKLLQNKWENTWGQFSWSARQEKKKNCWWIFVAGVKFLKRFAGERGGCLGRGGGVGGISHQLRCTRNQNSVRGEIIPFPLFSFFPHLFWWSCQWNDIVPQNETSSRNFLHFSNSGKVLNSERSWTEMQSTSSTWDSLNFCSKNIFWKFYFSLKYTQWQCILSFDNSTAMYKDLETLHPGGIQTRDLLFWRRTRWPLCHAARAHGIGKYLPIPEDEAPFLLFKLSIKNFVPDF